MFPVLALTRLAARNVDKHVRSGADLVRFNARSRSIAEAAAIRGDGIWLISELGRTTLSNLGCSHSASPGRLTAGALRQSLNVLPTQLSRSMQFVTAMSPHYDVNIAASRPDRSLSLSVGFGKIRVEL